MVAVVALEFIKGDSPILGLDLVRICTVVDLNDELMAFYGYERERWYQDAINKVERYLRSQIPDPSSAAAEDDSPCGSQTVQPVQEESDTLLA